MNSQRIDDKPQERESPVRHAHAVQASHHGRASAPGYLGLPADEEPENAGIDSEHDEAEQEDSEQESDQKRQRGGKARAREAKSSSNSGRNQRKQDDGKDAKDPTTSDRKKGAQQAKKPRAAAKASTKSSGRTGGRAASKTSSSGKTASTTGKAASTRPKNTKPRKPASKRASGGSAKAAAASIKSKVASVGDAERTLHKGVRKEAFRVGGSLLKQALVAGSRRAAQALGRSGSQGLDNLLENMHRLPIQQSIDVAVPPEIAWKQWMELKHLPEGVQRLSEVQRDGDQLTGRIAGARGGDWSADVIDEREQESFAWRSTEGTDSAGLATFHSLGDRLTRIELTLDVRPEDLSEAARLMLHIADRRVEEELRRFKVDAELLNPDVYEQLLAADSSNGAGEDQE